MRDKTLRLIRQLVTRAARDEVQRVLRPDALLHRERELERRISETVKRDVEQQITKAAATTVADAVRREHHETVRMLANQASLEALLAARPEFVEVVKYEVERAFRGVTPPVLNVFLPGAPTRRLDSNTHRKLPDLLKALHARCHVLLVGQAGTGKSMMAVQAAQALGLDFKALSLGPTTPMSKVFGYYDASGRYHDTPFRRAFEDGGVMLLDELDNGHPGLLGELNQALALRRCAFADGMVAAHADFVLVATANTYGHGGDLQYVGRQALDAATLDRFTVIDVPVDEDLELRLVLGHAPTHQKEARSLLEEVRRLRKIAATKRLPLVFSPRAGIDGAKLLEAGATLEQAIAWRVTRGLSAAHRTALGLPTET